MQEGKSEMNKDFIELCHKTFDQERLFLNAPMRFHTTFCIGGSADLLFYPASIDEVQKIIQAAKSYGEPITLLGNGSNILVRDGGLRGLVIRFNHTMGGITVSGTDMTVGAGALLKDVASFAQRQGLTGMEFASGIPGSIGGAIFMNAGAYDGEMKSIVTQVKTVSAAGEIRSYSAHELEFDYRHSIFHEREEAICEVRLHLSAGNPSEILETMNGLNVRRKSKQPLEYPSAGSTFKRPPGYFAGTLIDEAGLKGFTVGGAQVSQKHAGFIVNIGGATANDVQRLIAAIQARVYAHRSVRLMPELRIIGTP
jgi:UDP-N-acetylmuramate dehydrogenase